MHLARKQKYQNGVWHWSEVVYNIIRCRSSREIISNEVDKYRKFFHCIIAVRYPIMDHINRKRSARKAYSIAQLLGPSCKSTENSTQYRVCFRNLTDDDASIYWIDFKGKPVYFGFIRNGKSNSNGLIVGTFMSHPWIAVNRKRKHLLAINFAPVFRPMIPRDFLKESIKIDRLRVLSKHQGNKNLQPEEVSQPEEGQHVDAFITELVLKLELSCCLKICKMFSLEEIKELEIPMHIREMIANVYDSWLLT